MRARLSITTALAGSALMFTAACRYTPTPVVLQAAPADIQSLAGSWEGTYQGRESERTGTITFTIDARSDTAHGDVLMEAPMRHQFIAADVASGEHQLHSRAPEVLRITWVGLHRGFVEGALEPYIAPDCQCAVKTVFHGSVVAGGDEIKGEFVTTGATLRQQGTWTVRRRKP